MVIVQPNRQVLQIVCTLRAPSRLARGLYCRKKQGDQYADNGNDNEQLHKRETGGLSQAPGGIPASTFSAIDGIHRYSSINGSAVDSVDGTGPLEPRTTSFGLRVSTSGSRSSSVD